MKENWLTRKASSTSLFTTLVFSLFIMGTSLFHWHQGFKLPNGIAANPDLVFIQGQYWRAWTTLFIHGDGLHLASNLSLFAPFFFLLFGYFGGGFAILFSIFMGGITNLIVLQGLPSSVGLVGLSGVVHWLGGAWLMFFFLIDRRHSVKRRFAIVLFLTVIMFFPHKFEPEVSYYSHFIGLFSGGLAASFYYWINMKKIEYHSVYYCPLEQR